MNSGATPRLPSHSDVPTAPRTLGLLTGLAGGVPTLSSHLSNPRNERDRFKSRGVESRYPPQRRSVSNLESSSPSTEPGQLRSSSRDCCRIRRINQPLGCPTRFWRDDHHINAGRPDRQSAEVGDETTRNLSARSPSACVPMRRARIGAQPRAPLTGDGSPQCPAAGQRETARERSEQRAAVSRCLRSSAASALFRGGRTSARTAQDVKEKHERL